MVWVFRITALCCFAGAALLADFLQHLALARVGLEPLRGWDFTKVYCGIFVWLWMFRVAILAVREGVKESAKRRAALARAKERGEV